MIKLVLILMLAQHTTADGDWSFQAGVVEIDCWDIDDPHYWDFEPDDADSDYLQSPNEEPPRSFAITIEMSKERFEELFATKGVFGGFEMLGASERDKWPMPRWIYNGYYPYVLTEEGIEWLYYGNAGKAARIALPSMGADIDCKMDWNDTEQDNGYFDHPLDLYGNPILYDFGERDQHEGKY